MILVIDNYDSFVYNLVQYFGELGEHIKVLRNDEATVADIAASNFDRLVISPGPCTPHEAGISMDLIRAYAGKVPILGVCLGHQAMAQAFGGRIMGAKNIMHGKVSQISHDRGGLFVGLPNPFVATRYHSLAVDAGRIPPGFEVTAYSEDGEIMGIRNRALGLEGVQFHPESILTQGGKEMLKNFIRMKVP